MNARRLAACAAALAVSLPAPVLALLRARDCSDTPCTAFWFVACVATAALVPAHVGVGVCVAADERAVRWLGVALAVGLAVVDAVVWLVLTGA